MVNSVQFLHETVPILKIVKLFLNLLFSVHKISIFFQFGFFIKSHFTWLCCFVVIVFNVYFLSVRKCDMDFEDPVLFFSENVDNF